MKTNDVNLMSMARSTDFCFKTTYVGMFLCFRSIVRCFQCFVHGLSPFGKQFPMNLPPPYPLEITPFEPPLPLGISNDLPWGGGGMDIFWNHTISRRASSPLGGVARGHARAARERRHECDGREKKKTACNDLSYIFTSTQESAGNLKV